MKRTSNVSNHLISKSLLQLFGTLRAGRLLPGVSMATTSTNNRSTLRHKKLRYDTKSEFHSLAVIVCAPYIPSGMKSSRCRTSHSRLNVVHLLSVSSVFLCGDPSRSCQSGSLSLASCLALCLQHAVEATAAHLHGRDRHDHPEFGTLPSHWVPCSSPFSCPLFPPSRHQETCNHACSTRRLTSRPEQTFDGRSSSAERYSSGNGRKRWFRGRSGRTRRGKNRAPNVKSSKHRIRRSKMIEASDAETPRGKGGGRGLRCSGTPKHSRGWGGWGGNTGGYEAYGSSR